ncbi:MAG TPA: hypothetical protein DCM28_02330 [Phycisphaerales bacterium]|nr:hypothetical protein [Phycisphaerales bacterium]HCD31883.1 hypothetical protein [Phycisphaerales bacterium]|tara:strand:- start:1071 stop:1751 length:681 start_codon:yes stop_codon:yes gene_type:complete
MRGLAGGNAGIGKSKPVEKTIGVNTSCVATDCLKTEYHKPQLKKLNLLPAGRKELAMRKNHLFTMTAVLLAGLAFGSVNTASAARGDSQREDKSYRHDNDRSHNSRSNRSRHDDRHDNRRDRNRYDRHDNRHKDNRSVIIKKDRDRWNVGDALLYHFGRSVINGVFEQPRRTTVVIKQGRYDYVWVAPVYEYRRRACGTLVKVVVREGFYKKIWIPATTSCETGYH